MSYTNTLSESVKLYITGEVLEDNKLLEQASASISQITHALSKDLNQTIRMDMRRSTPDELCLVLRENNFTTCRWFIQPSLNGLEIETNRIDTLCIKDDELNIITDKLVTLLQ